MKKLFLLFTILLLSFVAKAQDNVGSYQNDYFGKEYPIEASLKNNKIESVWIGVEPEDSKHAYLSIEGKNLELFVTALELVRDKYAEWVEIAREHNVTEMNKEFDIKFPSVTVAWLGSQWWFAFNQKVKMRFLILSDGKMVAVWTPKVTSSSNRYIDQKIYFTFSSVEDFNNLISQLNYQAILNKLLSNQSNEELFQ